MNLKTMMHERIEYCMMTYAPPTLDELFVGLVLTTGFMFAFLKFFDTKTGQRVIDKISWLF